MAVRINGIEYEIKEDKTLLSFLRDDLRLTGTKDGCSEGACGTCTVIIDGKAQKACVFKLSRLEGKSITTIEGLSEREKQVYSYAFAKAGAVQCGYCIPGMIMSAKALIDSNADPSEDDVKKAIRGNLCRCTGYVKIIKAILLASRIFRENLPLAKNDDASLGSRMIRIDAEAKALGEGLYTDDIVLPGMLYASAVRSPYPRAKIVRIDTEEAEKHPDCVRIIRKEDVPFNMHGHLSLDWPVLFGEGDITSYIGDALVIAVSKRKESLEEIKALVKIEAEELEGVYTIEDARKDEIKVHYWGQSNMYKREYIIKGDADSVIKSAPHVIERHFETPVTEHAFMETECAIAWPHEDGGVNLITGGQSIYDDQRECARMLRLPPEKVHVKSALVGGGFGGKEDMSVQHHAALSAYILKQPVKIKLSRNESLAVHPKRHPMSIDLTLAFDDDGKILALKEDILTDTGAYASLGGPVLQRACTHAGGPYNFQNLSVVGIAYYTNNPPNGAFRGFGVTQSCFALEAALDEAAKMLSIDPFRIREINVIRSGQALPSGQIATPDTAAYKCLEALKDEYYKAKYKGIAMGMKNAGIGMGVKDSGRAILSVEGGKVHIRTSAACMGQGVKTVCLQIASAALELDASHFIVEEPDTDRTPDSGTSTASRQTAFTGEAVRLAAIKMKKDLDKYGLERLEGESYKAEFSPPTDSLNTEKEHPVSHLAYSYSAQLAILDDEGRIKKIISASDAGTVINLTAIEAQMEGGVVTGMGYALTENFITEKGRVKSKLGTLGLLRSTDIPEIQSIFVEPDEKMKTSYGAKGIGELSAIPTAPAIRNAYYMYTGKPEYSLPLANTPYSRKK